jgi:hypothetical protein
VITLSREASSDIPTDTRTGAYHQTNRFHVLSSNKRDPWLINILVLVFVPECYLDR